VYGLPRIFLDIALLWQPFHKAHLREKRGESTIAPKAHLPSWSWCGWTCPVDPYHLRTRSSYLKKGPCNPQITVWETQKLVQWYSLSEDMQYQVPADRLPIFEDGATVDHRADMLLDRSGDPIEDNLYPTGETADTINLTGLKTDPTSPLSPKPLSASPLYGLQSHDTWPYLLCQTFCLALYIGSVLYGIPVVPVMPPPALRGPPFVSVFNLPYFAEGPTRQDTCDLICLKNEQGLPAGILRHMEQARLMLGDTVVLIAISTGAINSTDVEGDDDDKLYKLDMLAYVGPHLQCAKTSEYLGQYDSCFHVIPHT
jgi:hypothetical protein